MKFRRRSGGAARDEAFINLASLIDVIFVLLLFFVVTTTFNHPSQIRLELPQASQGQPPEAGDGLEITIGPDSTFALNGKALQSGDQATLSRALQQAAKGDTQQPLVISADGRTPHQAVVTAMDAAGQLGFTRLRITTVEEPTRQ